MSFKNNRECPNCGQEIKDILEFQSVETGYSYCSRDCANKHVNENYHPEGEKLTAILKKMKPIKENSIEFQGKLRDEWEDHETKARANNNTTLQLYKRVSYLNRMIIEKDDFRKIIKKIVKWQKDKDTMPEIEFIQTIKEELVELYTKSPIKKLKIIDSRKINNKKKMKVVIQHDESEAYRKSITLTAYEVNINYPFLSVKFIDDDNQENEFSEDFKTIMWAKIKSKKPLKAKDDYILKKNLYEDLYQISHAGNSDLIYNALRQYTLKLEKELEKKGIIFRKGKEVSKENGN